MPVRHRKNSLWKSFAVLGTLLLCLIGVLQATSATYPSRSPSWHLEAYNREIARNPTPKALALRAYFFCQHDQRDRAIADIREAIKLNPNDLGQTYVASSGRGLPNEALQHGEQQLRQMLKDRPEMSRHIEPGDALWTWAVRKFAGEDIGKFVFWSARDPIPFHADSHFGETGPAIIRIRARESDSVSRFEEQSFDRMWSMAVFELHNLIPQCERELISRRIHQQELTRDESIVARLKTEELAAQRTRAFYISTFLPWRKLQQSVATEPANWQVYTFYQDDDDRTAAWQTWAHWPFYGAWYDLKQVELNLHDHGKAELLLAAIQPRLAELGTHTSAYWHHLSGCLRVEQKQFENAILEFNQALSLDSGSPWPRLKRANAYLELGRTHDAYNDYRQLVALPACDDHTRYDALVYMAHVDRQRDLRTDALGHLNRAIELAPDRFEAYHWRAYLHALTGDYAAVAADLSEILRLNPDDASVLFERSRVTFAQELWPESLADVNAALLIEPDSAEMFAHRGWVYFNQGRFELATADFARALELDASLATALVGRGSVTMHWKDHPSPNLEHAFNDVFLACELLEWQDAWTIRVLAYICETRGNNELADEYRQKAEQLTRPATEQSAEPSLPSRTDGAALAKPTLAIFC